MKHEKLPKDQAPKRGNKYVLSQNGKNFFEAEFTTYGGGCWATVQVIGICDEALPYKVGDTFDIRVAMYEYTELAEYSSNEN